MAELQAAMSSREFAEWRVYAAQEPIGERRADLRMATVATLIAESNRDRKRRGKPFRIAEFLELFQGGANGDHSLGSFWGAREEGTCNVPQQADKGAELWANLKMWATRGKYGRSE